MSDFNSSDRDVERGTVIEPLYNSTLNKLTWEGVTVTVTDRKTKAPKKLLDNVGGDVKAGKAINTFVFHGISDGQ